MPPSRVTTETASGESPRHCSPDLPRPWIRLPRETRRAALADPLTGALCPSHVGYFPDARRHRIVRPEGVDTLIVKYCVKGRGFCEVAGRRFPVGQGDVFAVPRGLSHAYASDERDPWTVYWFHAQGDDLESWLERLALSAEAPVLRVGLDAGLLRLFRELVETLEEDPGLQRVLYASQVLHHLLGRLLLSKRRSPARGSSRDRVRASIELMSAQPERALDVRGLASRAGLSTSRYAALFRELSGSGPRSYLEQRRMERAAELLRGSSQRVADVALSVGYADPLHFSRAFRRRVGLPPTAYRLQHSTDPSTRQSGDARRDEDASGGNGSE